MLMLTYTRSLLAPVFLILTRAFFFGLLSSAAGEDVDCGGEGRLVAVKLFSSSISLKLSLRNSSSSENEMPRCLLSPLRTTLSVVVNATKGLNSSSELDSRNCSNGGITLWVSLRLYVRKDCCEAGAEGVARANLCSSSLRPSDGRGEKSVWVRTVMTGSLVLTVRCRGSSPLTDAGRGMELDGWLLMVILLESGGVDGE